MRFLKWILVLIAAVVVFPPLWYVIFPVQPAPDLPQTGRRVEIDDGFGLNVVEMGEGPAVVLIHGLPGSAYDWRAMQPELAAAGRRVIAYDRVGYGRSDARRDDRFTVAANVEEVGGLLDAMDLEDVTVVGWSYGGATAIVAATQFPERIGRVVLVGTGGPDSAEAEPPEPSLPFKVFYSKPVLRWRVAVPPLGIGLMKVLSATAFSDQSQPDWWLDGLRANLGRWDTLMTYRGEMMTLAAPDEDAKFAPEAIRQPVLLLHGDDDRLATVAIARYLDSVIPDSRLKEYAGGSHMLPVTHPRDLADQIVEFSGGV